MKKFPPPRKSRWGGTKNSPPRVSKNGGLIYCPPIMGGKSKTFPPHPNGGKRTTIRFPPTCLAPFPRPNHTFIHRSLSLPAIECQPTRARGLTPDEGPPPIFSSAPSAPESVFQKSSERFQNVRAPQAEISRFLKSVNTISKGKSMTQTLGNAKIFRLRRAILFFTSPLKRFNRGGRRGKAWRCGKH